MKHDATVRPVLRAQQPVQQQLLATGTHFEPTGSDAAGPQIEVCDACRCDVAWAPGRCTTPEAHRWADPGAEVGEEPSAAEAESP